MSDRDQSSRVAWLVALDRERAARATAPQSVDDLRAWWASISDLLKAYTASASSGHVPSPPPTEVIHIMGAFADALAAGVVPEPISDVGKGQRGVRRAWGQEADDIGLAVAYRLAATPGGLLHLDETITVADSAPVKTLMGWFGVSKNTIQGWVKERAPAPLGLNRLDAAALANLTQTAGARYRSAGRGQAAIAGRARGPSK